MPLTIPASMEAEESVLGSILMDGNVILQIRDLLSPGDFYREVNGWIYEATCHLFDEHQPIDLLTVMDQLERKQLLKTCGGFLYLSGLVAKTVTSAHIVYYAQIIERAATMRRLADVAMQISTVAYAEEQDVDGAIDQAERLVFEISERHSKKRASDLPLVVSQLLDRIDVLSQNQGEIHGVPTGFGRLDKLTGGLQRSDLVILAARPSVGKTAMALQVAHYATGRGKQVGFFSLEMSTEQLVQRMLAAESGIDQQRLRLGDVQPDEWPALVESGDVLSKLGLYIDDTPAVSMAELRTRARRMKLEHNIDLLCIDYIQLMRSDQRSENRNQELSYITRSLKALARELNIPVLALSQLSRAVEQRQDHVPILSDLRDSGSIEQDADIVMFLYRSEDPGQPNIVNLSIAKHRNGPTDVMPLYFRNELTRFADVELYRVELNAIA